MLRRVLAEGNLTIFAVVGLVLFFLVFLGVAAWILTRGRREVDEWARIPLTRDEDGPVQDRGADGSARP